MGVYLPSKMTVAYDNLISPSLVQSITLDPSTQELEGFSKDNLKFPDPGRISKFFNGGNIESTITVNLSEPRKVSAVGIIRHNLSSASALDPGVSFEVFVNGAAFTQGTTTIIESTPIMGSDSDILMYGTPHNSGTSVAFKIIWGVGSTAPFYIGSLFIASDFHEMSLNPSDGQLGYRREQSITIVASSGGTRHMLNRGDRDLTSLEFTTRRAKARDVRLFNQTLQLQTKRNKMLGVTLPYEYRGARVHEVPHFFGYLQSVTSRPRIAWIADPRYDLTATFIGV